MNKNEYFKKWWEKNKHLHRSRVKRNNDNKRKALKLKVSEYLSSHSCVDCGNDDIRVLEFDHVRGVKLKHVSTMVQECYSWDKIVKEIEKCEVRCANCHRIITGERRL